MARLLGACRRLRAELFRAGGATIDTPAPVDEESSLVARTVVQPDGDIVYLVDYDRYAADADLRELHRRRVLAWLENLETTVTTSALALRRAGLALAVIVVLWTGFWARSAASLVSGLVMTLAGCAVGLLVHASLRVAIGHALRGGDHP